VLDPQKMRGLLDCAPSAGESWEACGPVHAALLDDRGDLQFGLLGVRR